MKTVSANEQSLALRRALRDFGRALVLTAVLALPAGAAAPEWVMALWGVRHADYGPEVTAVCLLNEGRTEVTKDGEIKGRYRIAYKILTREGLGLAWLRLPFDSETRISNLKAWNVKPDRVVHEVGQKEATETQLIGSSGILFEDNKSLVLLIPQVDVDSVVAVEFERRHRPYVLQDRWTFQQRYPVLRSRFELEIPDNWEFTHTLLGHVPMEPVTMGKNNWVWELTDLPGIPEEEGMPPLRNLSARLNVNFFPSDSRANRGQTLRTWDDFARWTSSLMEPRFTPSPEMSEKARQLAAPQAVAEFVQKEIRYVAIEIGIGGYQPHFATETFRNRYGDCKDKVTLLNGMLKALEREVYTVLIHTGRHSLAGEFPSPLHFNHMIAALPVAEGDPTTPAMFEHAELGRLLLFDPTDTRTPFGQLPSHLQGTTAVLIRGERGFLIDTPVTAPAYNRLMRTGTFDLFPSGRLHGAMREMYWGELAAHEREWLRGQTHEQWMRGAERQTAQWLPGALVKSFSVAGLDTDNFLREDYQVESPHAVEGAGELLLFRPALFGEEVLRISREGSRSYDYSFRRLRLHTQGFTFRIPEGYVVEELPPVLELDLPFAKFRMQVTTEGREVKYLSSYEIRKLAVPASEVAQLREFYDFVERASRMVVLLKRAASAESGSATEIPPQ